MAAKLTTSSTGSSKPSAGVYAVCGPEPFLKRQALSELVQRVLGDADRALAMSEYDGSSGSLMLADVLDDVRTLPLLARSRLVLVREADNFITRYRQELEDYTESPSPAGVLVLECKSLPGNTRLYKRIDAGGGVVKCEGLKPRQVPDWVARRAIEAHGKRIDPRAVALLCGLIGTELGLLDAELQKLAVYVDQRAEILATDVEALCGCCKEEEIWGLLSAMASGNTARALTLWEEVWQTDRAASARAIGGLAFSVRRLLTAKRAQEAGASMDDLRKIMMIWGDDSRVREELAAFSARQIEWMLCRLQEADLAAKTGGLSVRSSIEKLIVDFCTLRRQRRATG